MKAKHLLRTAALLLVIHLIGHTFGHITWRETPDPVKQEVIRAMEGKKFPFMGVEKSMGDYYEGYGLICFITLVFFASVQWLASRAINENTKLIRQQLTLLSICLVVMAIIEWLYFFPFAALITALSAAATVWAIARLEKE